MKKLLARIIVLCWYLLIAPIVIIWGTVLVVLESIESKKECGKFHVIKHLCENVRADITSYREGLKAIDDVF